MAGMKSGVTELGEASRVTRLLFSMYLQISSYVDVDIGVLFHKYGLSKPDRTTPQRLMQVTLLVRNPYLQKVEYPVVILKEKNCCTVS
jgi:hypothetical protein